MNQQIPCTGPSHVKHDHNDGNHSNKAHNDGNTPNKEAFRMDFVTPSLTPNPTNYFSYTWPTTDPDENVTFL